MKLILPLIRRYKRLRDLRRMNDIYTAGYAMVGFGNHAVHQLLPAIQYLGLPLRYVCCTSTSKAEAVARKYPGLHGTTSLREVLDDKEIRGVFVAATPSVHFAISRAVLESGKALFVEKPPCTALEQLDRLIETAKAVGNPAVTVGFQRRFCRKSLATGIARGEDAQLPLSLPHRCLPGRGCADGLVHPSAGLGEFSLR